MTLNCKNIFNRTMQFAAPLLIGSFMIVSGTQAQQWTQSRQPLDPQRASIESTPKRNGPTAMNFGDMPAAKRNGRSYTLAKQFTSSDTTTQRSHLISLSPTGDIEGRIAAARNDVGQNNNTVDLSVYFVRNGAVAYQTQTNRDGSFRLAGVADGPYSFVATGPSGIVTYGVYVTRDQRQAAPNVMEAAAVPPKIAGLKQILADNLPLTVTEQILKHENPTNLPLQFTASANQVRLIRGQLSGQVYGLFADGTPLQGTMINLIQNGQRVAEVQVDSQGRYTVSDLQPGTYDFIAVGHKGLAAIRFEAIGQDGPMTQVAYRRSPKLIATSLDVCLTCATDNSIVNQSMDYSMDASQNSTPDSQPAPIEYASQSVGCGGAAGVRADKPEISKAMTARTAPAVTTVLVAAEATFAGVPSVAGPDGC